MKKRIISGLIFTMLTASNIIASTYIENTQNTIEKKNDLLIGYYGRPNTSSLGILGQSSIEDLVIKMKKQSLYYQKELDNKINIQLAFHLIYGLATKDAGKDNDYIINLNDKTVMKYINAAQKENFAIIIDMQLGIYTPKEAVAPILKYLKYKNVHLAIDPEFKIPTHRRYPPGKFIGHIYAKDLNLVQELISNYLIENNITEKKKLIVHMFHPRMLRKRENVKNFDNIDLIYNIDGHGAAQSKINIYNSLVNKDNLKDINSGFKIFLKADKKPLMRPREILGLKSIKSSIIKQQPTYINYQ
ncbi:MAG: hypothetical protein HRT40_03760 [Campylobacteraceae bacterium]|nr:hypothetical protein [Campylobacteraceae bacterium]